MSEPPNPSLEEQSPKKSFFPRFFNIVSSVVWFSTGALLGIIVVVVLMPAAAESWDYFLYGFLGAFAAFSVLLLILWLLVRRKIKAASKNAGEFLKKFVHVFQAENLAEGHQRLKSLHPQIEHEVRNLLLRRWFVAVLGGVGVLVAGLFSSILLFQQNKLVESQNSLIKQQVSLQGRSLGVEQFNQKRAANLEFNALIQQVTDYFLLHPEKDTIPRLLVNSIASSSKNFHPYRFPSDPNSEGKVDSLFLSPERGGLFLWLINGGFANLSEVLSLADFSYSDLRGAKVRLYAPVEEINLSHACFNGASLNNINWPHGNLEGLQMKGAILSNVSLYNAVLDSACLDGVTLERDIDLTTPKMRGFSMQKVKFSRRADSTPIPRLELSETGWKQGRFDSVLVSTFR